MDRDQTIKATQDFVAHLHDLGASPEDTAQALINVGLVASMRANASELEKRRIDREEAALLEVGGQMLAVRLATLRHSQIH